MKTEVETGVMLSQDKNTWFHEELEEATGSAALPV